MITDEYSVLDKDLHFWERELITVQGWKDLPETRDKWLKKINNKIRFIKEKLY